MEVKKTTSTIRIRNYMLAVVMLLGVIPLDAQNKIPANYCISAEEMRLFQMLNTLRSEYGKPALKLSTSLSFVARTHVIDLQEHHPDTSICNLSSWSDQGNWKACCYNPYVPDQDCMWDKPKELTSYPYRGYELVTFFEDKLVSDSVVNIWAGTKKVLDMILTRGDYKQKKWICMGVGMNGHYASVWFGQRADKTASPVVCDTVTEPAGNDTLQNNTANKGYFYVIYGSFDNLKDAKEALKRVKKSEFSKAGILQKDGRYRVYLNKFDNIKAATFARQSLPYTYKDAWILKY